MNSTRRSHRTLILFSVVNFLMLAGILASVLLFWKPWDLAVNENTRKVSVTGSATVEAEPDQYQFNPTYTRDTTEKISQLNDQIITTLKNLGVKDSEIKNNASRYGSQEIYYLVAPEKGEEKSTLNLTITVDNKKLAQKVQDYLVTTNPSGSITPYASFSTSMLKKLQNEARGDAIKDARKKADQTASELGVKIGKVISVSEGSDGECGYGAICYAADTGVSSSKGAAEDSISVQPGTDEYTYSFTVVFALD